jgi:hypothetical protein
MKQFSATDLSGMKAKTTFQNQGDWLKQFPFHFETFVQVSVIGNLYLFLLLTLHAE